MGDALMPASPGKYRLATGGSTMSNYTHGRQVSPFSNTVLSGKTQTLSSLALLGRTVPTRVTLVWCGATGDGKGTGNEKLISSCAFGLARIRMIQASARSAAAPAPGLPSGASPEAAAVRRPVR